MRFKGLLSLLVFGLVAFPATAAQALTLREAVATGLERHPEVQAARYAVAAAQARETRAAAWPNPNVSLFIDQVPLGSPMNGNYLAGVSQPMMPGGLREAQREVARAERELAELDVTVVSRELATRIKVAYVRYLYEQEEVRLARLNADFTRTVLEAAKARYKAGEFAQVEVLRTEVELGRAQRAVAEAESQLMQARGRLNVLLGHAAQADLAAEALPAPRQQALPGLTTLVAQSFASRAEFRRAELAVQRETRQRQVAQASLWTGTEVAGAIGAVSGQPGFSATLTVPIPLYRQQGEVAEARANELRAQAQRDSLRNEVTLEVEEAYRKATIAAQQANLFTTSYIPQAERLAENARMRFGEGEGSGQELFQALRALGEARTEHLQAVLEYRMALAWLEGAVGAEFTGL